MHTGQERSAEDELELLQVLCDEFHWPAGLLLCTTNGAGDACMLCPLTGLLYLGGLVLV